MNRNSIVRAGSLAGLVVLVLASPASAKGPGFEDRDAVAGRAAITGPGLDRPMVLSWHGDCLMYCMELTPQNTFVDLAGNAGLFGFRGDGLLNSSPKGDLGAAYVVRLELVLRNGERQHATLEMYPYGPGDLPPYVTVRPWFHIPPGIHVLGEAMKSGWWPASPLLLQELKDEGLPGRNAAAHGSSRAGMAAGLAAFGALLLAGAILGRPRRRRAR
jgi:hypothetical protein